EPRWPVADTALHGGIHGAAGLALRLAFGSRKWADGEYPADRTTRALNGKPQNHDAGFFSHSRRTCVKPYAHNSKRSLRRRSTGDSSLYGSSSNVLAM